MVVLLLVLVLSITSHFVVTSHALVQTPARLFYFKRGGDGQQGSWEERGTGTAVIARNAAQPDSTSGKHTARICA